MLSTSFRRQLLLKLAMLADLCVFTISVFLVFWTKILSGSSASTISFSTILHLEIKVLHSFLFFAALIVWHLLFRIHRLYKSRRLDKDSKKLMDILRATTWGTGIFILFGFVFDVRIFTPAYVLLFWFFSTTLTFIFRITLSQILKHIRLYGRNLRFILIVGTNQKAYNLARKLEEKKELGYRIIGYVDEKIYVEKKGINLLGTLKDFRSIIKSKIIDEIIITLPVKSYYEEIQNMVQAAEEQGIKTRYLADIFETEKAQFRAEEVEYLSDMTPISGYQKDWYYIAKRVTDIILASFILVIASPIMLLTAFAIKYSSPGPILFIQTRVGLNKRQFSLYKFRTMVLDAEKRQAEVERLNEMDGPVFKVTNDPRVTNIGRWLRKTSIDELPQLFNVLKGDMSLVGPRPLPLRDYNGFDRDWQRKRFSVLPGITCIWQISGRNEITFEEWMKMDIEYVENWTPLFDFKILLKTIPAVIMRRGAV